MNKDEQLKVAHAMMESHNPFIVSLGKALFNANAINADKIKDTWISMWSGYLVSYDEEVKDYTKYDCPYCNHRILFEDFPCASPICPYCLENMRLQE